MTPNYLHIASQQYATNFKRAFCGFYDSIIAHTSLHFKSPGNHSAAVVIESRLDTPMPNDWARVTLNISGVSCFHVREGHNTTLQVLSNGPLIIVREDIFAISFSEYPGNISLDTIHNSDGYVIGSSAIASWQPI